MAVLGCVPGVTKMCRALKIFRNTVGSNFVIVVRNFLCQLIQYYLRHIHALRRKFSNRQAYLQMLYHTDEFNAE